jgi:glycosyltransferase involved in cell wall biosynthesis
MTSEGSRLSRGAAQDAEVVCAVFVSGPVEPWVSTLASIRKELPRTRTVVGSPDPSPLVEHVLPTVEQRVAHSVAQFVNELHDAYPFAHIFLLAWPVVLPPDPLDIALGLADADLRCSCVCFFSNAAGYLSFPHRDSPSIHQIDDLDEQMITRKLRHAGDDLPPVAIPYATGPAVLLTSQGLSVTGPFPDRGPDIEFALAEHSCRARCHGMIDYLDPSTFVLRPRDIVTGFPNNSWISPQHEAWLNERYPGVIEAPREPRERSAALGDTFAAARASVGGLRVVVDGSVIGPKEMGTQVAVLALVDALAARPEIASIGVSLALSAPPQYAAPVLQQPKVDSRFAPGNDFSVFGEVDVIHRPFQSSVEGDEWRRSASRIVMTLHDLIAYQVPVYHETASEWFRYREAIRNAAADVDGLIVLSEDIRRQVVAERLGIEASRVFVVPNGVGHLSGEETEVAPDELLRRGFDGDRFLLVLGADYAHKNRGRAVEVLRELNAMGHGLSLVLAGAHVPYGSSRTDEDMARTPDLPVFVVPDVSSAERNWLLRHASVVLYLTSAEGFGLVPHEAAAFGTPTVFVPFGPLGERFPDLVATPADWSVAELAKAADLLLRDPEIARQQVDSIVRDTKRYDWSDTATGVVDVYRAVLAKPPRHKLPT